MERSASGSPDRLGRVDDALAARLIVDAAAREVLGVVLGRALGAAEISVELGRDIDAVLYRLKRLLAAGLVRVVEERRRGGRPIKVYRAVCDAFFVPFEALPYADVEETLTALHRVHAERLGRASARHLTRTPWAGFVVERRGDGRVWMRGAGGEGPAPEDGGAGLPRSLEGAETVDAAVDLRLTPDEAGALNEELRALLDAYLARSEGRDGRPNRLLVVASVPLDE